MFQPGPALPCATSMRLCGCRLQQRQRLRERREANRAKEGLQAGANGQLRHQNGFSGSLAEVKAKEAAAAANAQVRQLSCSASS